MKFLWQGAWAVAVFIGLAAGEPMVSGLLGIGLHAQAVPGGAAAAIAPGDRVTTDLKGGLKGVVVRIGGAGDAYYYRGCFGLHFDYEENDPDHIQWFCPQNGTRIFKLDANDNPIARAAPGGAVAPAVSNVAPPVAPPVQQATPAAPMAPPQAAAPVADAAPAQPGPDNIRVSSGSYECYGASSPLGGFNFTILAPGEYADIDGKPGTYTIAGGMLTFHDGAHDGQRATFFPGEDARHPPHITFENTGGGGLGISCDTKA